jgi:hypothetical protein
MRRMRPAARPIALTTAARSASGTRSLLDLRQARALAVLADEHGVGRTLNSAEQELERSRPEDAPAWVSWMSPADLEVEAGRCWLDLDQPARAEDELTESLQTLAPSRARTRSIMLTHRAEGAIARKDLPAAASGARAAFDTAMSTGAARCMGLVRTTIRHVEAHSDPLGSPGCSRTPVPRAAVRDPKEAGIRLRL